MTGFDAVAAYYEVLANADERLKREGPFLLSWLEPVSDKKVLDVACGTGVHALFFAEQGAEVIASDLSEGMIAFAQSRRPHAAIVYRCADMRSPGEGTYDLILCLGNSISLLGSRDDLNRLFQSACNALNPGGAFIIQLLNYAASTAKEPRHRVERKPFNNSELIAVKNLVPHGNQTLLSLTFFDFSQTPVQTISDCAVLTHWSLSDFFEAASESGLKIEAVYGAYDRRPFDPEKSADLILIIKK